MLLGTRLYFPVTPEVLVDDARYEAAINDIVQEVRRRAPLEPAAAFEHTPVGQAAAAAPAAT